MTDPRTSYEFRPYEIAPMKKNSVRNPPFVLEAKQRLRTGEIVFAHNDDLACPRCLTTCYSADHKVRAHSRRFQTFWTVMSAVAAALLGAGYFLLRDEGIITTLQQSFEAFMVLGGLVWAAAPTYYRVGGFGGFGRYSKTTLLLFVLAVVSYVLYAIKVFSDLFSSPLPL